MYDQKMMNYQRLRHQLQLPHTSTNYCQAYPINIVKIHGHLLARISEKKMKYLENWCQRCINWMKVFHNKDIMD